QIFVISTQVRNRSIYDPTDVNSTASAANPIPVNLQARPVKVAIAAKVTAANGVDLIAFDTGSTNPSANANADGADEGCFVIIARDNINAPSVGGANVDCGRMNGRVYRLGARRTDFDN